MKQSGFVNLPHWMAREPPTMFSTRKPLILLHSLSHRKNSFHTGRLFVMASMVSSTSHVSFLMFCNTMAGNCGILNLACQARWHSNASARLATAIRVMLPVSAQCSAGPMLLIQDWHGSAVAGQCCWYQTSRAFLWIHATSHFRHCALSDRLKGAIVSEQQRFAKGEETMQSFPPFVPL